MITYQDFLKVSEDENKKRDFVWSVIADHKNSELYKNAVLAEEYDRRRNRTITNFVKYLFTVSGRPIPDQWSSDYKLCSNFFDFIVTQENQYLLGNGVTWQNEATAAAVGVDFDTKLQLLGKKALIGGEGFGFWNLDHLEIFDLTEFAPLYDEDSGYLRAGVRFWQLDITKPTRATFYEPDGYTEYIQRDSGIEVLAEKRPYILHTVTTAVDGTEISEGENYPTFPIVPMWGSLKKQSEIVGIREDIDAYDLIKSGFANDIEDASQIYWILEGAGGMDDAELAQFVNRIHTTKAVNLQDGIKANAHTLEVPYQARETMLNRLRDDLFEHAMAFDPKKLSSGGSVVTAAIKSAYVPLDEKTNEFEYCVQEFLQNLLSVIGITGEHPTFTRSIIINQQEQIQTLIAAAEFLPSDYVTMKIATVLGDGDLAQELIDEIQEQEMQTVSDYEEDEDVPEDEDLNEEDEEETDEDKVEDDDLDAESDAEIDEILNGFLTEMEELLKKAEEDIDSQDDE